MSEIQQRERLVEETRKNALAGFMSLTPLLLVLQFKGRYSLDRLHIALLELLFLLVCRVFAGFHLRSIQRRLVGTPRTRDSTTEGVKTNPEDGATKEKGTSKRRTRRKTHAKPVSPYPPELLDYIAKQFINIIAPESVKLLPPIPSEFVVPPHCAPFRDLPPLPLNEWKLIHSSEKDVITVMQHPKVLGLYGICCHFPGIEIRRVCEILMNISRRPEWDSLCDNGEVLEELEDSATLGRRANITYLKMKGMAVVKAKDIVLCSIMARLPDSQTPITPTPNNPDGANPEKKGLKRVVCATSSIDHGSRPEGGEASRGFARMKLGTSGFVIEEDGMGGTRLVQITDLSGLGSWIPSSILKSVTTKLMPAALRKVGRLASELDPSDRSQWQLPDGEGEEWLPPILGTTREPTPEEVAAQAGGEEAEEEEEEEDKHEVGAGRSELDALPASASRSLHLLVSQLRRVTDRLSVLEETTETNTSASPPRVGFNALVSRIWSSSSPSSATSSGRRTSIGDVMSEPTWNTFRFSLVGALSGAVGAAGIATALWGIQGTGTPRRRRIG